MCDYTHSQSAIRVHRVLQTGNFTLAELADRAAVSRRSLDNMTATFFACGLVHICKWVRPVESKFQLVAVYRAGPGKNKPRPKRNINAGKLFVETSHAAHLVCESLKYGCKTHIQCADELGLAPEYTRRLIRVLNQQKRIHIVEWVAGLYGQHSQLYAFGEGKDKSRPKAQTSAQITRRRRERLRATLGHEIARRIEQSRSNGGPDSIVVDGKVVYRRREDRSAARRKLA